GGPLSGGTHGCSAATAAAGAGTSAAAQCGTSAGNPLGHDLSAGPAAYPARCGWLPAPDGLVDPSSHQPRAAARAGVAAMRGISRSTARGLVMPATLILLLLSATG